MKPRLFFFVPFFILLLPWRLQADKLYKFIGADGVLTVTNAPGGSSTGKKLGRLLQPSSVRSSDTSSSYREKLKPHVERIARKHGLNPLLIECIVEVESGFNPYAVSSKGAMGLMQLMPETGEKLNVINFYDPIENLEAGVKHLRYLLERFDGKMELALAAYNSGENAVAENGGIPPFQETQEYVKKIMDLVKAGGPSAKPVVKKPANPLYCFKNSKGIITLTTQKPADQSNAYHFAGETGGSLPENTSRNGSTRSNVQRE
jgi:hypothetical protein